MRVHQWVKSVIIFTPLFFALQIDNLLLLLQTFFAFLCFCIMASSIYIFNDYKDIDEDKVHPDKKNRPLAAGEIETKPALILMLALALISLSFAYLLTPQLCYILLIYLIMNLAYSIWLKHIAVLDISIIGIGFILRIWSGAVVADLPITKWIVLMTFLLALFLGMAKRRSDLILTEQDLSVRKSIDGYNLEFVHVSLAFFAAVTVVSYIMYTVSPEVELRFGSENIYLTSFFVIIGLLRYFQIALVEKNSGSPTLVLFKDHFIQLTILGWVATFVVLLYI